MPRDLKIKEYVKSKYPNAQYVTTIAYNTLKDRWSDYLNVELYWLEKSDYVVVAHVHFPSLQIGGFKICVAYDDGFQYKCSPQFTRFGETFLEVKFTSHKPTPWKGLVHIVGVGTYHFVCNVPHRDTYYKKFNYSLTGVGYILVSNFTEYLCYTPIATFNGHFKDAVEDLGHDLVYPITNPIPIPAYKNTELKIGCFARTFTFTRAGMATPVRHICSPNVGKVVDYIKTPIKKSISELSISNHSISYSRKAILFAKVNNIVLHGKRHYINTQLSNGWIAIPFPDEYLVKEIVQTGYTPSPTGVIYEARTVNPRKVINFKTALLFVEKEQYATVTCTLEKRTNSIYATFKSDKPCNFTAVTYYNDKPFKEFSITLTNHNRLSQTVIVPLLKEGKYCIAPKGQDKELNSWKIKV